MNITHIIFDDAWQILKTSVPLNLSYTQARDIFNHLDAIDHERELDSEEFKGWNYYSTYSAIPACTQQIIASGNGYLAK